MTAAPRTYPPAQPIWCAGCGHFSVLNALRAVLGDLQVPMSRVALLAGIGCSGTIQNYLGTYGYHALHGRVLPSATGIALADPDLTVIAAGGDGDGYAIGAGHLVHAFRRNVSFTYIVMNNQTYGLTKGQHSPTRHVDYPSHVEGTLDAALLGLSIPAATFIARGYSGWYEPLVQLTHAALDHARRRQGFAFLEVVSPCINYQDTYPQWEQALHDVNADPSYDPTDRTRAITLATELAARGRLATGLLYRAHERTPPEEQPAPARASIEPAELVNRYDSILDAFTAAPSGHRRVEASSGQEEVTP